MLLFGHLDTKLLSIPDRSDPSALVDPLAPPFQSLCSPLKKQKEKETQ